MRISLLGKSKLGFVDGRYTKDKFDSSLHDLWEKCNAIVLSWIMNSVGTELLRGMIYASSAYKVWTDLRETFDKVSGSRVLLLHKQIAILTQGIASVSTYFSKLKELWVEFDALMPCLGCGCEESWKYVEHFEYQRLLQFLMGLNESYTQSSNQMLMMVPVPSINKAYSMIFSEESRRSLTFSNPVSDICEGAALFSHKNEGNGQTYKQKQHSNMQGLFAITVISQDILEPSITGYMAIQLTTSSKRSLLTSTIQMLMLTLTLRLEKNRILPLQVTLVLKLTMQVSHRRSR